MMRTTLLVLLTLGGLVAAAPFAAAGSEYCIGDKDVAAVCETYDWYECFHFWVLGDELERFGFCIAP